jgi:prolipoprotein diacylglyceryl transferase
MVASLPSPSDGVIELGPLPLHLYGVMIALGIVAAVSLMGRRLEAAGTGSRDDAGSMATAAVLAGIVGARVYHVATEWERFRDDPARIVEIWKGGLGVPGGILLGTLVGVWAIRRRGVSAAAALTAAAPAVPLAQAIGRWGNWWNQELYGRATTLPWGLEIDEQHLVPGAAPGQLFHPTFLYESLWNLALCGVLALLDRAFRPQRGRLFAMYLVGYGVGRLWVEGLRIDATKTGGGLRLNQWMAIVITVGGLAYLLWSARGADTMAAVAADSTEGEAEDDGVDPSNVDSAEYVRRHD